VPTRTELMKTASAERGLPARHRPRQVVGLVAAPATSHPIFYTDGSVSGGRSGALAALTGWGFLSTDGSYGCGRYPQFTPRAGLDTPLVTELRAVWHAVGHRLDAGPVTVVLDSQAAIRYLNRWAAGSTKLPSGYTGSRVREATLRRLQTVVSGHPGRLTVQHAKGHAGDVLNEGADTLAQLGMRWARDNVPDDEVTRRAAGVAEGFLADWRRR
jgi:ribonuclease HI